MRSNVESSWYRPDLNFLSSALLPFSWLFGLVAALRRYCYQAGLLPSRRMRVPVIVAGNISVGGTGKTPFVIALAKYLSSLGYHPGIVSRGVGGQSRAKALIVSAETSTGEAGDEAVLLARRALCPVVVGADRAAAAFTLLEKFPDCNVIISDDGLQHYRLRRDIEIAIVDGRRLFGNGCLLPAGPLREPRSRLNKVDFVVVNSGVLEGAYRMILQPQDWVPLQPQNSDVLAFPGNVIHAVAGVGNPAKFFDYLRNKGYQVIEHIFPDHHSYTRNDFEFGDHLPIVMTEKDAVKCNDFADTRMWYVPVTAEIDSKLLTALGHKLRR